MFDILLKQQIIQEWTGTEFELEWQKVKTNNLLGCFEINQCTDGSFSDLSHVYNMVRVIDGKIL